MAQLCSDWYEFVDDPEPWIEKLRTGPFPADLVTFIQRIPERNRRHHYYCEPDKTAVLHITDYQRWWKEQINDKTRNMVRKAEKKGVLLRTVQLDDQFLCGVKAIYDESPLRQGRPFKHFDKDIQTLRREHETFLDRSEFIGAYANERLIGFVKLVFQQGWASMMQIIASLSEREKAPTNALIAKAVERCSERGVPMLQYGSWSRGGLGQFKLHHGFTCVEVPRYFVPLTAMGQIALRFGLHRKLSDKLPDYLFDRFIAFRKNCYVLALKGRLRGMAGAGGRQHQ